MTLAAGASGNSRQAWSEFNIRNVSSASPGIRTLGSPPSTSRLFLTAPIVPQPTHVSREANLEGLVRVLIERQLTDCVSHVQLEVVGLDDRQQMRGKSK